MQLEITPEPSDQERAAIAAALAPEGEPAPSAWAQSARPRQEELDDP